MFWSKKSKNDNIELFKECLELFDKEQQSKTEKDDHDDIVKLYKKIMGFYKDKIIRNEINIKAEKIRLEAAIGKYDTNYSKNVTSLFIGVLSALCVLFIDKMGIFNDIKLQGISPSITEPLEMLLKIISFLIILSYLLKLSSDSSTKKNKNIAILNNVKLKVLEDIEKEFNNKEKNIKEQNDKEEMYKKIEEIVNKNNIFDDVIMPAIYEVAAGTVKKDGWVRRLFGKKK